MKFKPHKDLSILLDFYNKYRKNPPAEYACEQPYEPGSKVIDK